jgi:hypothetical protein
MKTYYAVFKDNLHSDIDIPENNIIFDCLIAARIYQALSGSGEVYVYKVKTPCPHNKGWSCYNCYLGINTHHLPDFGYEKCKCVKCA